MDKNLKPHTIYICFIAINIVALLIMTGCQYQRLPIATVTQKVQFIASSTPTKSIPLRTTPVPTNKSTTIPTLTLIPETPLPSLTWTSIPTLRSEEAQMFVHKLLDNYAGCLFPCWWGIVPGQSSWGQTRVFLEPFAARDIYIAQTPIKSRFVGWFIHNYSEDGTQSIEEGYTVRGTTVEMIEIHFSNVPTYTLTDLLKVYGSPTEVWIRTFSTEHDGSVPFYLLLFYPEKGILAEFENIDANIVGNRVRKCFQEDNLNNLALWSPQLSLNFQQATENTANIKFNDGFPLLKLEEVTNLDVSSFYDRFRESTATNCLETPTNLWPEQFQ